jgi:hypothetical protein
MREVSESDLAQHLWKAYVRGRLSTKREGNGWRIELLWTRVEEPDGLQHCGLVAKDIYSAVSSGNDEGERPREASAEPDGG